MRALGPGRSRRRSGRLVGASVLVLLGMPSHAAEVSVAVAANFTRPAEAIGAAFSAQTGDTVVLSFGATGALYAQITQAAPFDILLAADNERPQLAVANGFGVEGTVFTYAAGKLALYSPTIDVSDGPAVLAAASFQHIAIADPLSAPYGRAAVETIAALGLADLLVPLQVTGQSISQTLQFVDSGNAELGFVALGQVSEKPASQVWVVPAAYHAPILQDAVLLKQGEANPAARAFLAFLRGPEATGIIRRYGYDLAQ